MGFLAFALLLPESASVPVTQGYAAHRGGQTLHRPFVPERRPGSMGRLVPIAFLCPYPTPSCGTCPGLRRLVFRGAPRAHHKAGPQHRRSRATHQ